VRAAAWYACSAVATSPVGGGGGGRLCARSGGEAAARCLPAVSDRVDGGVGDVDGEAWMALGHAWLDSDLRGTIAKR
jgi:hypothetical protein